jgi:hypothetical protein
MVIKSGEGIRKMAHFLFPDFLNDPQQYQQAEALWLRTWKELVDDVGQTQLWNAPLYTTTFVDGTPCRDGDPIFSAVDPTRRLGVRIIQFEPPGDVGEIVFWLDTFAEGEPEEVRELVISCSLTDETLSRARDLIRQWITERRVGTDADSAVDQPNLPYFAPADRPA